MRKVVGTLFSSTFTVGELSRFPTQCKSKIFFLSKRVHGTPLPKTDAERVAVAAAGHGLHILLLSFLSLALGSPEVSDYAHTFGKPPSLARAQVITS